ncbi:hypothetical protein [Persephonella sp. KM09-Lau-8]|uniref:hypothetical protein n=1 Tax=Persephonella sp. KM09-Lau-8 TaxID=1158345 RepID=UPI000496307E|nr:hypothetical protein [Persephonella sp. KM09-Lau-8]
MKKLVLVLSTAILATTSSFAWVSTLEKTAARKAAERQGVYTKTEGSMSVNAVWVGKEGECDLVHIDKYYNYSRTKAEKIEKELLVCPDKVSVRQYTPYDRPLKNKQVETEARRVAQLAQRYGAATGEVGNYIIEAFALRDYKECQVEVRIFNRNTNALLKRFRTNGCN